MINEYWINSKILLIFFLLLTQLSYSQYVEKKDHVPDYDLKKEGFFSFGLGLSNPSGDFKEQNLLYFYRGAGFARNGYSLYVNYGKPILKKLGVLIMISHSTNRYNTQEITDYYQINDPFATYTINIESYRSTGFLGGLMFSFPLKNGFIDLKALIGYSISYAPRYAQTRSDSSSVQQFEINSSYSRAISSIIGIGFRKNLNEIFALNFSLDYYATRPKFQHTVNSNFANFQNIEYFLKMRMVITSIGLVYRIRKF